MNDLQFKVLVHKETRQFGIFYEEEIWHSSIPDLLGATTTIEMLKNLASPDGTIVKLKNPDDLDDYILLEATLSVNQISPHI
jgi:hypothetical protein